MERFVRMSQQEFGDTVRAEIEVRDEREEVRRDALETLFTVASLIRLRQRRDDWHPLILPAD